VLPPIVWFLLKTWLHRAFILCGRRSPSALRTSSSLRVEAHASPGASQSCGHRRDRARRRQIRSPNNAEHPQDLWITFRHSFNRKVTFSIPRRSAGCRRGGADGSFSRGIPTARSGAWPATSAPRYALLPALPCRRASTRRPAEARLLPHQLLALHLLRLCEEACPRSPSSSP